MEIVRLRISNFPTESLAFLRISRLAEFSMRPRILPRSHREPGRCASKALVRWKFTWMACGCCGKRPAFAENMFAALPLSKSWPVHIGYWRNSPVRLAPLRIAISPAASEVSTPLRAKRSVEELTYDLAAAAYAAGEFGTAIEQINALPSASGSAALQFLLAQSWTRENLTAPEGLQAWNRFQSLAPGALAADQALGERALADGRLVEAAKFARHVLAASPNDMQRAGDIGRRNRQRSGPCRFRRRSTADLVATFGGASVMRDVQQGNDVLSQPAAIRRGRSCAAEVGRLRSRVAGVCAVVGQPGASWRSRTGATAIAGGGAVEPFRAADAGSRAATRRRRFRRGTRRRRMVADCAQCLRVPSPGGCR